MQPRPNEDDNVWASAISYHFICQFAMHIPSMFGIKNTMRVLALTLKVVYIQFNLLTDPARQVLIQKTQARVKVRLIHTARKSRKHRSYRCALYHALTRRFHDSVLHSHVIFIIDSFKHGQQYTVAKFLWNVEKSSIYYQIFQRIAPKNIFNIVRLN